MSTGPYRTTAPTPGTGPHGAHSHSLLALPSRNFIPMRGMEQGLCVDMYGDLPFGLFILENATLRGQEAYIFTSEGTPITEQNADFLRKKRFLKPRISEEHLTLRAPREFNELVSLTSRCDSGFFHWMVDSLPKVVIAEGCGFTGSYLIPSLTTAPWAKESLPLLGISPDRVTHHTDSDIRARRLSIPTFFSGYNAHHNVPFMKVYRETVRQTVKIELGRARERLLIVRKPATKVRRILNQEEVIQTANAFGFQPLYFEDLSLREQLARALSAEAILGAHGSGLCHSLFMDQGSTVIELFPYGRKQSCDVYEMLATIPQHRYHALESSEDREGDILVSTDALSALLARAFR